MHTRHFHDALNRIGVLLAVLVAVSLCGCASWRKPRATAPENHAFIKYWPAPKSGKLRLAVKDLIDVKGMVTTAGSEFLAKHAPPAEQDADCLKIARARDVHIVGKTNTTELAVAVSGINEYFGTPRNPLSRWRRLIPGGSSSGSAVAVASGMADVALGTDTAGSIRIPAACCGVVGLKTTLGRVPARGIYPIDPTHLDTVGPIAKNIAGAVQGMELLVENFAGEYQRASAANPSARSIRVGRLYLKGTHRSVDRAVDDALAAAGFKVVKLDDHFREQWMQAQEDAAIIAASSAWLYDLRYRGQPGITLRTKAIVALGELRYKTAYPEALKRSKAWKATLARVFQEVDFIALPTMQKLPPSVPLLGGTVAFEARVLGLQNTAAANLGGVPALAMPVPVRNLTVPVTSLQLIGPAFSEADLLNAGRLVEEAVGEAPHTKGRKSRYARN